MTCHSSLLISFIIVFLCPAHFSAHAVPSSASLQPPTQPQQQQHSQEGHKQLSPAFSIEDSLTPQNSPEFFVVEAAGGDQDDDEDDDNITSVDGSNDSIRQDMPVGDSVELEVPYDSLNLLVSGLIDNNAHSQRNSEELGYLNADKRAREFIGKRAREFIGKRAREFIGKRAREFIGKRAREFIGKRAREFIGKRAREFIGKRAREFIGKRAREFIGKRAREFIGKRSGDAVLESIRNELIRNGVFPYESDEVMDEKRAREFIGKRAREFIGKRAREFIGKRAREFSGKRAREFIGKRAREFIGKRDEAKRAREFIGKRAREFIGKRAREFIGKRAELEMDKRAREFIGKRDGDRYKFDDGYYSGSDESDSVDGSTEKDPFAFVQYELQNPNPSLGGVVYPAKETSSEDYLAQTSYNPRDDTEGLILAAKRAREFIGKRFVVDNPYSKRAREFIGKRSSDFDNISASKRAREFIGKRDSSADGFRDFAADTSLSPSLGIK